MRPPIWCGRYYRGAMRERRADKRAAAEERQSREAERDFWRAIGRSAEYERAMALEIASSR
ncbi:hypothetical protein GCM10009555_018050 [Acrocarpospora macrocephala]|uniref:Uncharacterized protein n=1 Tax=Acrocarpospora macrocephala TaxID=150177 RepID=A0A5M3WEE5_9ACTN|nr:hypothetical protein [Acrocarpospora macrocephala]GES07465.1 hypothetical protein Amac_010600 [Acrocarpospora macrocephala]